MAKILIVDDEPDVRYLSRMIFESAGHEVIAAHHGAAALDSVKDRFPDLVVTDMMMPVVNGNELIEALRSDPDTASIPILVISCNPEVAVGADAVLEKFPSSEELLQVAGALLAGEV